MSETNEREQASTSVWYFVGATFILTIPGLMFPELPWWARIGLMLLGFGVMIAGFTRLRRELGAARRPATDEDPDDGAASDSPPPPPTN